MLTFKNEDAQGIVRKNLGEDGARELGTAFGGEFLPFPELEKEVERDVQFLRASKLIPGSVRISGWVYEVETGRVRSVV